MRVLSASSVVPPSVVTNDEVESHLGLEPGWIERRTGIVCRPTAQPSEATSDLAIEAGRSVLEQAAIMPSEVGLLLLATSTPDHLLPPTAPLVAHRLGLQQAGALDLAGACAGFLYALVLGNAYGESSGKHVIVIGANILTRRVNTRDPATAALFSDGAGAVLLAPSETPALLGYHLGSDGSAYDVIGIHAGGSREPLTAASLEAGRHLMEIRRGTALFKQAVQAMARSGEEALKSARIETSDVDWWIPHQANARITAESGRLLGIPPERTISVVERCGNSSAATIPIALADAVESGRVRRGNILLFAAAGAGLVSAAAVLRW